MTPPLSQGALFPYFFIALIGLIILRGAYRVTQGVRVVIARLVVIPVIYIVLYVAELSAVALAGSTASIAPAILGSSAVDAVLVVVGALLAYQYALRHVELYRVEGDPAWRYRMSAIIPIVYVSLFFARVALETAVLGESPLAFPSAGAFNGISPYALYTFFAVDALWGLSTGFLIGRSAAVYHTWRARLRNPPAPSSSPSGATPETHVLPSEEMRYRVPPN